VFYLINPFYYWFQRYWRNKQALQTNMEVYIQNSGGKEKNRVKVVKQRPSNVLVSWVPGGMDIAKISKEMNLRPFRT
jgi:hypothetical protein